jgi:hypothetical protein
MGIRAPKIAMRLRYFIYESRYADFCQGRNAESTIRLSCLFTSVDFSKLSEILASRKYTYHLSGTSDLRSSKAP